MDLLNTDIKSIGRRGSLVYIFSAAGVDVYVLPSWTRRAWASLPGVTCGAVNDNGVYLGTAADGLYRLAHADVRGESSHRLEQAYTTTSSAGLQSNVVTGVAGYGTALLVCTDAGADFLPTVGASYHYADAGGCGPACAINATELAYVAGDGRCYALAQPSADWTAGDTTERPFIAPSDYALSFDGTDDYVSLGAALMPTGGGNWTVEFWADYVSGDNVYLFSQYKVGATGRTVFYVYGNQFTFYNSGSGALTLGSATDGWTHVAATWDGTTLRCYLDGIEVATDTGVANILNITTLLGAGFDSDGTTPINFIGALMDDVRVWSVARTQQEIQDNMDAILSGTETGLVALYTMDEGSGATLTDGAGSNDGTIYGATWVEVSSGGGTIQDLAYGADLYAGMDNGLKSHDGAGITDHSSLLGTVVDVRRIWPSTAATASAGLLAYGSSDDAGGGQFAVLDLATEAEETTVSGDVTGAVWLQDDLESAIADATLYQYAQVTARSPSPGARGVRRDWTLYAEIADSLGGIQAGTVVLKIGGAAVSPTLTAVTDGYRVEYTPASASGYAERVDVDLSATDADGNTVRRTWSFWTEQAAAVTPTDSAPPNVVCIRDIALTAAEADEAVSGVNVIWLTEISGPLIVTEDQAREVGRIEIDGVTYHRHLRTVQIEPEDAAGAATGALLQGQIITLDCPAIGMVGQRCEVLSIRRTVTRQGGIEYTCRIAYYEAV